jgi:hypothetical protein
MRRQQDPGLLEPDLLLIGLIAATTWKLRWNADRLIPATRHVRHPERLA